MFAYRTDVGTLRPAQRMPDGRLRVDALITRPGIFEYADPKYPGGIRRELRRDREVFSPQTMASFAQMPATNDHPPEMLTADNARRYMVGSTGEQVDRVDNHVHTSVMVADSDTIASMENGNQEVSVGYGCLIDETGGVDPVYGRYDVEQLMIRGNHLAVAIARGRAGRTARVRMDSEISPAERELAAKSKNFGIDSPQPGTYDAGNAHGGAMDPQKLQETIAALNASLKTAEARADKAEAEVQTEKHRADVADGKMITLQAEIVDLKAIATRVDSATETAVVKELKERADKAEQLVARFDATLEKRVEERASLISTAMGVLGPKFRTDGLNDRQIRVEVVKRLDATADVGKDVPDGVIVGRFLSLVDGHNRTARSLANVAEVLATTTPTREDGLSPREKQNQELRDQWKKPLPNDFRANGKG